MALSRRPAGAQRRAAFRWQRTQLLPLLLASHIVLIACQRDWDEARRLPLTSRVLSALSGARPYVLRIDGGQQHVDCPAPDTSVRLPQSICARASDEVTRALSSLAPTVATALSAHPDIDALWASALLDLSTGEPDSRQLERAIIRLSEVHARDSTLAAPLAKRWLSTHVTWPAMTSASLWPNSPVACPALTMARMILRESNGTEVPLRFFTGGKMRAWGSFLAVLTNM